MAKKPKPNEVSAAKKPLPDDETALFQSAMRDVDKLRGKKNASTTEPARKTASLPRFPPRPEHPRAGPSVKPNAALPNLAAGKSADVDSRTMDRLRRGRLRPEARLDLHGLTQDKAHRALDQFIAEAQSSGIRSIVIITGKGRVSEGGGVLRNQVPNWLNASNIRPSILAFSPAQPKDGGSGALYVLLRRRR